MEEVHILFTCCSRSSPGIWTLFPESLVSGSHLPLCVATVNGSFWTNFVYFQREKWTRISLQFTLGNLDFFYEQYLAVSACVRLRCFYKNFTYFHRVGCPGSLRSSHLKIWTLFLLAVIWRWEGVFGGSDAFFALLWVVPELSASFWSPRW